MPKRRGALTEREAAFVDALIGKAKGNATLAAKIAGYSPKTARQAAARLLTKVNVQKALVNRREKRKLEAIATADERDRYLSAFVRDETLDAFARIGAVKELNKVEGRHSMTHIHKGKLTLEQALGQSREGEAHK